MPGTARKILRQFGSIQFFLILSVLMLAAMIVGTLAPQWDIYHRPWFSAMLLALAVNTVACVVSRWGSIRMPSLISHLGILCILLGSAITLALGVSGHITLKQGMDQLPIVYNAQGERVAWLPFKVKLQSFQIDYHHDPKHQVLVVDKSSGARQVLSVAIGEEYDLHQGKGTMKVKYFNPDFYIDLAKKQVGQRSNQPNNPALLLNVKASPARDLWVFAGYPGMHQEDFPFEFAYAYEDAPVKQFTSDLAVLGDDGEVLAQDTIWVNKPLRYGGYTFYQASYDPNDHSVSILQVAKDPGVPVVYAGFAVLMLGLTLTFIAGGRDARA